jgi:hypothetical protein
MRKFRIFLLSTAVLVGVGTAVASGMKARDICTFYTQYYYSYYSGAYFPIFENSSYICIYNPFSVCTYWKNYSWNTFEPCTMGELYLIQ